MWFRNLHLYRLHDAPEIDAAHLVEALEQGGIVSAMDAQGRRRVLASAA